jgi:hypothetical protein
MRRWIVNTTAQVQNDVATSRFPSVFGPRDDGTGINWSPPYPGSGSTAKGPGRLTGPDLNWDSFDGGSLEDGDEIVLTTTQLDVPFVQVVLKTPSNITWWKDIEIQDWTGAVRAAAWTSDQQHSQEMSIPNGELSGLSLHFKKAKFLGIHAEVYNVPSLVGIESYRLEFNWLKD